MSFLSLLAKIREILVSFSQVSKVWLTFFYYQTAHFKSFLKWNDFVKAEVYQNTLFSSLPPNISKNSILRSEWTKCKIIVKPPGSMYLKGLLYMWLFTNLLWLASNFESVNYFIDRIRIISLEWLIFSKNALI